LAQQQEGEMKKDQIDRLNDIAQRIGEVLLTEADPDNWSGAGIPLRDMDEKVRGNRYWDKKNAIQTGTLLARVIDLAEYDHRAGGGEKLPDHDVDKDIKRYEKQARELIDAIQSGGR
jgi:hypothetical protein